MKNKTSARVHHQVRIIGGAHRGRRLTVADVAGLRPTADSVRERVFNWLGQDLGGLAVLDLFAGSGALGLEAVSRHAATVVLVEDNPVAAAQLRRHIRLLGEEERVCLHRGEALDYLRQCGVAFDVVFLDPPFAWQDWPRLWTLLPGCLHPGAMVYAEAGQLPLWPDWLELRKQGRAGMSRHALLQLVDKRDGVRMDARCATEKR